MSGYRPFNQELTMKMLQSYRLQRVQLPPALITVPEIEAAGFEEAGELVPGVCNVDLDFPGRKEKVC